MARSCRTPSAEQREEPASEMEADTPKKLQGGSGDKVQMLQRKTWPPDTTRRRLVTDKCFYEILEAEAQALSHSNDGRREPVQRLPAVD